MLLLSACVGTIVASRFGSGICGCSVAATARLQRHKNEGNVLVHTEVDTDEVFWYNGSSYIQVYRKQNIHVSNLFAALCTQPCQPLVNEANSGGDFCSGPFKPNPSGYSGESSGCMWLFSIQGPHSEQLGLDSDGRKGGFHIPLRILFRLLCFLLLFPCLFGLEQPIDLGRPVTTRSV